MPVKLRCTSCDRLLRVPRRQVGLIVRCPSCGTPQTVPAESSEATPRGQPTEEVAADLSMQPEANDNGLAPRLRSKSSPPPLPARKPSQPPKLTSCPQEKTLAANESAAAAPPPLDSTPEPATETAAPPAAIPPPLPRLDADSIPPPAVSASPAVVTPPLVPPPPASRSEPPPAPVPMALPGVEYDWLKRWPVYQLGMWAMALAVISMIPALLDMVAHARQADSAGISRWALALFLAGGLQIAYAVYLMQLPDWATAWVMSIVMLVCATAYAALLGALTLANQQSQFVQFLELGDKLPGHQATTWCVMMLTLSGLLAYFSGRISFRWRRTYWRWARP